MTDDEQVRTYLRSVQTSLHLSRQHQRRVLEEIENHIHDGSVAHMRAGATRSDAIAQVIAELGPPEIVGAAFAEETQPASPITGTRRWLPLVLPVILLAAAAGGMVWTLVNGAIEGWTTGRQLVSWWYVRTGILAAFLVYVAASSIRRADRDPARRRWAWACTGCVIAYLILEYGSRLRLVVW